MRVTAWILVLCWAAAAGEDPLPRAYEALQRRSYDEAIRLFLIALEANPGKVAARKDLAYTYLKTGETVAGREQFREAMRLAPEDAHLALEYAFLCFETGERVQARRVFDRLRKAGGPASRATAAQAFENIDAPLRAGMERWKKAIALGADNFSSHFELARLAEERDETELAAEHYERAWKLLPDRRGVLLDLGRMWKLLNRIEDANAAFLSASRGGTARAAETARELLPARYPYVNEFRRALALDPGNSDLRRELGFLLLRMNRQPEAEQEFRTVTETAPADLLAAAQLGFLYYGRGEKDRAMPLLNRVVEGGDEELKSRVRAVLRDPQKPKDAVDAKAMAERSIRAGYIQDAVKYLQIAYEANPQDFEVVLKLGWAHNLLHQDAHALRWFGLARSSPDPRIAAAASRAYRNLRPQFAPVRTTFWMLPFFSTRWHEGIGYGQFKTEFAPNAPLHPYVSARLVGDTRHLHATALPGLSEDSVILGAGLGTKNWHGLYGWAEAGSAFNYHTHHMLPDYRGGVSFARGFGTRLDSSRSGPFLETNADAAYISRFDDDVIGYIQNRAGVTVPVGGVRVQLYWNGNFSADTKREYWGNQAETGPGLRIWWTRSVFLHVNAVRGAYLRNQGNPYGPNFYDLRIGFWYAFSY